MADKRYRDTKVVIVGGSVTGLTLANMLERLGIDYVLLEAYENLAPQLGASIALWANGLRIMDQLGCYDEFAKDVTLVDEVFIRLEGKPLRNYKGFGGHYKKRHGYPVIFNDRQKLLEILRDKLQDQSKIQTKKRVVRVETLDTGVRVHTEDGDTFEGDMLVGADGVHSLIRREMWRLGNDKIPGLFPSDEMKAVPIHYRALFAISPPHARYPEGLVHSSWNKGYSILSAAGPGGRVYWFVFEKLDKPITHGTAPRFTAADEAAFMEKYRNDVLYSDLTLGELYDKSSNVGMIVVHEFNCARWHFERIMTIGDAAHKLNPLTGQGGNNAIEDCAAFVNALTSRLDNAQGRLSTADFHDIFTTVQAERNDRAQLSVDIATKTQKLEVLDAAKPFILRALLPLLSREARLERQSQVIVNAVRINNLPLVPRPHFMPYPDELPAKPLKATIAPKAVTAVALGALYYLGVKGLVLPVLPSTLTFLGGPFKTVFTGLPKLDFLFGILVKFFSVAVTGSDPAAQVQAVYFLASLLPVLSVWTVESRRRGNKHNLLGKLVTWPSVIATLYQLKGIAKIAPLYYMLSLATSSNPLYNRTTGRPVEPATAQAILPAVALGYIVPSVLMLTPWSNHTVWQNCIAAWQVAPLLVSPLTSLIAKAIRWFQPKKEDPTGLEELTNEDVPHLQSLYEFTFWASGFAHIAVMSYIALSSNLSLTKVFLDVVNPFRGGADAVTMVKSFFRYDLIGYAGSALVWCLYNVYEMRRLGYVTTKDAKMAGLLVVGAMPLLGPGAVYAKTWHWRENAIFKASKW